MSSFTTALVCKRLDAPLEWEVVKEFEYHVGSLASGFCLTVPQGFVTDFASIPRYLWWLWPPQGGLYDKAAVIHDFLYRRHFAHIGRVIADAIFLDAMITLGVPRVQRTCLYLGVRAGGWWTYRQYRKAGVA